jgi:tetratricopeptide (TPR) repeat protein
LPEPDEVKCADGNAVVGTAILACTRLLESGRYDGKGRVAWLANRGLHQQRAGRLAEAVQDLSAAIQLVPDDVNLYLSRGASHGMAGELDAAVRDFEKVLALDPQSGLAYMNRATALEKKGDYAASQRDYDKAVELVPSNWIAWDGRCWLRAIVGNDLDGALADCERALQMQPNAANTLNTRGFVLFRQGLFDEAVASYDASIRLDPNVASSYYVRGLARQALGEDARADLIKAIEIEPGVSQRYARYGVKGP